MNLLAVALGGALGATVRYLVAGAMQGVTVAHVPVGVLSINVVGSFLIGLAWAWFMRHEDSPWQSFVLIGCLGAFTTYSTFAWETVQLWRDGWRAAAVAYVLASNTLAIGAAFLGFRLG
ncbi:MAG: fluoride efflux transporter CrcB [Phycisphaerales bacterium]|nr:fluoride efflux transporter CrcB [Phycisphaerales bacterium]